MNRRRSADDAKTEIREAALDLFLQHGYDATSLEEVAERVGLTRPAVLYHFGSKEALLLSVVAPGFAALDAVVSGFEADSSGPHDPADVLRALVEAVLEQRRRVALITRFASEYSVGGIGERAQRLNRRVAEVLGGPALLTDPVTRVKVVAALTALTGVVDARIEVALDTADEQDALVTALVALLKS